MQHSTDVPVVKQDRALSEQQADVSCRIAGVASGKVVWFARQMFFALPLKTLKLLSGMSSNLDVTWMLYMCDTASFFFCAFSSGGETDFLQLSWAVNGIDYRTTSREGARRRLLMEYFCYRKVGFWEVPKKFLYLCVGCDIEVPNADTACVQHDAQVHLDPSRIDTV
jgi:hypothetical protein